MTTPYDEDPREVWSERVNFHDWAPISERTGYTDQEIYENFRELERETELYFDIPEEQYGEFWEDFIDAMITGDLDRDEFFDMWEIDPAEFDWADWREMMGY